MSPPPDVRFISRKWPPAVGGMETYSVRITEEIAKRGKVEVIALPGRRTGDPPSPLALAAFAARVASKLLTQPPSPIVHVGDLASWPFAWLAKLRHSGSKIIISAHGSDASVAFRDGVIARLYKKYLHAGATLLPTATIIANSNYVADLSRRAGFRRVRVVPLATDFTGSSSLQRTGLLYVGRISRRKGLRFIVEEVLPRLPAGTTLRVAGVVWQEAERELLGRAGVDYLGPLSAHALAEEYARAAAVLIPTRESEGFGLVAIEAAACGAFVIASAHSGLADVVHQPIGTTVPAHDPDAWVTAIREVLTRTPDTLAEYGEASKTWVDAHYRWPRVADATWALYNKD